MSLLVCQNLWIHSTSTQSDRTFRPTRGESTWLESAQASPKLIESFRPQAPYRPSHPTARPDEKSAVIGLTPLDDKHHSVLQLQSVEYDDTYKRVTLAKLVKGVYELEHRRLTPSTKKTSPVHLWWESLNFEFVELLEYDDEGEGDQQQRQTKLGNKKEEEEGSINLAVYRWKHISAVNPPPQKIVIAIRGTLPRIDDGWHNMHIPLQRLHETPRYKEIMRVVKSAVVTHGSRDVCIVGHSLGAALGLLVARTLAVEENTKIETHLFNPVYPYTWLPGPQELIEDEFMWGTVRGIRYAAVAGLTHLMVSAEIRERTEAEYLRLQDWTPHLYINKGDPICRGYWEYFYNHERLAKQGSLGARVSSMAAPYSTRGLIFQGSKPTHLFPSAVLHVCPGAREDYWSDLSDYENHNLKNWWKEDIQIETRHVHLFSCFHLIFLLLICGATFMREILANFPEGTLSS
ncbi:hypothetical protein R1sor_020240 [Riccia sorocarpa]|uniref:Fungal lipase-type domain-containing protein n=1 Tax=Riccia sorocarpa TaxID=122646 RepID=A0ABD3IER2_9MARC